MRQRNWRIDPSSIDFKINFFLPCSSGNIARRNADYLDDEKSNVFDTLGLHWRENFLKQLAQQLVNREIPSSREDLLKLPAIGDYISSAYRSLHLGIRDGIIDSNVIRIYGRYFGFDTHPETRREKWFIALAERITPRKKFKKYNYGLIDFTREICKPRPACSICCLKTKCQYYRHVMSP